MRICPYESCRQCGACGVCRDFHGDVYGKCGEDCPYTVLRKVRDIWRRWRAGSNVVPPWWKERRPNG